MKQTEMSKTTEMIQWFDEHWYKVKHKEDNIIHSGYIPSATTKLGVVAKPYLYKWYGNLGYREAKQEMREKGDRGSRIHNALRVMATGGKVIYNPWQRPFFSNGDIEKMSLDENGNIAVLQNQDEMYDVYKLEQWFKAVKPVILGSELIVYKPVLENFPDDGKVIKRVNWLKSDAGSLDLAIGIDSGEYLVNGTKKIKLPGGVYVVDLKTGSLDEDAYMQTAVYSDCYESVFGVQPIGTLIIHTGAQTKGGIAGLATKYRNRQEVDDDLDDYRAVSKVWIRKNASAKPKVFEFPKTIKLEGEQQ